MSGDVETVAIAHKGRLCRVAFDLVEWILQRHGCKTIVVHERAVAIDPGVRSFIRTYDECGDSIQVDALDTILIKNEHIRKLQRRIDTLKKKRAKKKKDRDKDRFEMLRLLRQKAHIEIKTKNRVKDMHYKLASWLCREY